MIKINFIFNVHNFSISAIVKWILSACLNIRSLSGMLDKTNVFLNEIARLKKLKEIKVMAGKASELKEVTFYH